MRDICSSEHRDYPQFLLLPEDQSYPLRHHCAGCAYELGVQHARQGRGMDFREIETLPYSQASNVRHRSPEMAYRMGYDDVESGRL